MSIQTPGSFDTLGLEPRLMRGVRDLGYDQPTPVQLEAIPPALAGRDVLACAMTGSGKTAAFVLPLLQRLQGLPRGRTRALVLTPTRELAAQILEATLALGKHSGVRAAAVFGGVAIGPQERAFREGVDVLVATPGRLLDHLQHAYARLDAVEVLVLDEADRMLDMGFLPDVRRILARVPKDRQTLLFSATMPGPIASLSREFMRDPALVNRERKSAPAAGITQAAFDVAQEAKPLLLLELIRRGEIQSAIAFTRTKHRANRLYEFLTRHGVEAERIHGNRSQPQRTQALAGFKAGKYRVLVATDIAARGIDVEALEHVLNFDVPAAPEDYIHRVGRTARAERTGDAITFVSSDESHDMAAIERAVGKKIPRRTLEGFDPRQKPAERFEVPIAERIAQIRAKKAEDRARTAAKLERKGLAPASRAGGQASARPTSASAGRAVTAERNQDRRVAGPTVGTAGRPAPAAGPGGEGGRRRRRRGGGRSGSGQG